MKNQLLLALSLIMSMANVQAIKIDSIYNTTNSEIKYAILGEQHFCNNNLVLAHFSTVASGDTVYFPVIASDQNTEKCLGIISNNSCFYFISFQKSYNGAPLTCTDYFVRENGLLDTARHLPYGINPHQDDLAVYETFSIAIDSYAKPIRPSIRGSKQLWEIKLEQK